MLTDTTSKHIFGTTELTCLMPIKSGFVGEFETRTYATRLRIAMKVLHGLRLASREVAAVRVFPDIVDVIRSIHSFRLSIVNDKHLLLAVTFDRPWEPYMRVVWKGLGPLLDVLLINCVDYEAHASDKGFDRFSAWVRRHQIDAGLFYAASPLTVDDIRYLTQLERKQLKEECPQRYEKTAAAFVAADPLKEAKEAAGETPETVVALLGLKAISAFYGLREGYPHQAPDGRDLPDAGYLHRAARETLKTFDTTTIPPELEEQFEAELAWFKGPVDETKKRPPRPPEYLEMQGGILPPPRKETDKATYRAAHGCLLLARIVDPVSARRFLHDRLIGCVTHEGGKPYDRVYTNLAFTFGGLKRLEVSETELARFPKEFREGMEARAGLLGDVQSNHPTKWSLPAWNWPDPSNSKPEPVRLSTIDVVIKMRSSCPCETSEHAWSPAHPLYGFATRLFADANETGVQVMSVQPMLHYVDGEKIVDHFGFVDGISQPVPQPDRDPEKEAWDHDVALGELFLGYHNDRRDPAFLKKGDPDALPGRELGSLLDNGTFLVVRKLSQDVAALKKFLDDNQGLGDREQLLAKMMGRDRKGDPITRPGSVNAFDYGNDNGTRCPLHAHIRRGNPREGRVPRIVRRGMSYGPRYDDEPGAERGLMFLAYNASIAEQFEVIQRWMTGGNSTGGFSGHPDPFLRVPQSSDPAVFRFVHNGDVLRLNLGSAPFVTLKWGMYLFVPSMSALKAMASEPKPDVEAAKAQIELGERVISSLQTDDDWSAVLEDVTASHSGTTAAVYAAIRARGGVLRTPGRGMVLVASKPLVMDVLKNDSVFSVSEYQNRMGQSIGKIYLGLDSGDEYWKLSDAPNKLVSAVPAVEAFGIAENVTAKVLGGLLQKGNGGPVTIPLDALADRVLAGLSTFWFGVPNGEEIKKGGRPAAGAGTVHLPFHSLAPSRYIFSSPRPRKPVTIAGQRYGQALRDAVRKLAVAKGSNAFPGVLAQGLWQATTNDRGATDHDLFARMLVGLIEGFLPTVYGNFLKTMHLWLSDEALWRVQQDLRSRKPDSNAAKLDSYQRALATIEPELKRAMQRRPVPDIVYRTATRRWPLGGVTIEQGERVVALIASATQELAVQRKPEPDVMPVFGGDRNNEPHPTHACPAYKMGMGVLLGMISALLEAGTLKPTESPLAVTVAPVAAPVREVEPTEKVGV